MEAQEGLVIAHGKPGATQDKHLLNVDVSWSELHFAFHQALQHLRSSFSYTIPGSAPTLIVERMDDMRDVTCCMRIYIKRIESWNKVEGSRR